MQVFGQKSFSSVQFLCILLLGHRSLFSRSSLGHRSVIAQSWGGGNRGANKRLKVVILRTISAEKVHFLCSILQFTCIYEIFVVPLQPEMNKNNCIY